MERVFTQDQDTFNPFGESQDPDSRLLLRYGLSDEPDLVNQPPPAEINEDDPLVIFARSNQIEVVAGEICPECGEFLGRTVIEFDKVVACLGALVDDPWKTCSWNRPDFGGITQGQSTSSA